MKFKLLPVVLLSALTTLGTLYIAGRISGNPTNPFADASGRNRYPVSFASDGNTTVSPQVPAVDFQRAAEASVKAVVHIKTTTNSRIVVSNERSPFSDWFGLPEGPQRYRIPGQQGSGSGVVVSQDGYIVTNNHVIAGASEVTVTFNDRFTTKATVVGADPSTDIAVLKVDEKDLVWMDFGNSDDVHLGQWVLAVGYPLSLDATVTAGIVSAKSRAIGINRSQSMSAIESFIQTDAAVNPGNSGGALVNGAGQLVGINSAIASPTGSYAGYSYAIPANIVKKVVADLRQFGAVQRGYLGIEYLDRRNATAAELRDLGIDRNEGVYVKAVRPGSGAATSALSKGDFITQVNGVTVRTEPELLEQIARYKPGDNLSVTYSRGGRSAVTTVQLRNISGNTGLVKDKGILKLMGASFRNLTSDEARRAEIEGGVMLIDPGTGPLAKNNSNMKKGFVITSVDEMRVRDVDDFQQLLLAGNGSIQIAGLYLGTRGMFYYGISSKDVSGAGAD